LIGGYLPLKSKHYESRRKNSLLTGRAEGI
jgi:hypothetical protein